MSHSPLSIWCIVLTIVVVVVAVITDLLWRRIPNLLTFPVFGVAVIVHVVYQGWAGLGLSFGGAILAPALLLLMHGGTGIGMGELKLAAVIGAILGPVLAVVTVLLSALAGGILAIFIMLKPGGQLRELLSVFLIGLPFQKIWKKKAGNGTNLEDSPRAAATMPYGVAIGAGSLLTLAVYWWTGNENWFLSFVGITGNL